jgi:glycosyltransferase involved in cell wall biosynthesis
MKILYYSSHPHLSLDAPTGYGTHMREMIQAWRKMGLEVRTLIAGDHLQKGSETGPRETSRSKLKRLLPPMAWESLKDLNLLRFDSAMEKRLIQAVKEFQPDFIYERVAYLQNSGIRVARKLDIPHVAEVNAPYPEERVYFSGPSLLVKWARNTEREILVHSKVITVVSSALKSYMTQILPEAESRIHVVPNCVNPSEVHLDPGARDEIRGQLGLREKKVIGFVGSIFPYHGVDVILRAFATIENRSNLKLLIVGDGETLPDLKQLALQLGVAPSVVFSGSVPHREVYPLIAAMDICCMAKSNWYGSPVKIFEYALLKKPVIAPDTSPVQDVMEDYRHGILVEPRVEAFRAALEYLIQNPTEAEAMAEAWYQKVMEQHTWDLAAKRIFALCTSPS